MILPGIFAAARKKSLAQGSLATVTLTPPAGSVQTDFTAEPALPGPITVTPPVLGAFGPPAGNATGALETVTLTSPAGSAVAETNTSGDLATVTLTAPDGAASIVGAGHRYWRLNLGAPQAPAFFSIYEFGMNTTIGGTTVTTGGTPFATENTGNAFKAFDGNTSTHWDSSDVTLPQVLGYDFGSGNEQAIVEISLTTSFSADGVLMPKSGDIQWSDDNSSWTTAFSFSGATWSDNTTQTFS